MGYCRMRGCEVVSITNVGPVAVTCSSSCSRGFILADTRYKLRHSLGMRLMSCSPAVFSGRI